MHSSNALKQLTQLNAYESASCLGTCFRLLSNFSCSLAKFLLTMIKGSVKPVQIL